MEFQTVDIVRANDDSGLVATITSRKNQKGFVEFTFAVGREFEPKFGEATKRTSYIPMRAVESGSLHRLIDQVADRIKVERDRMAGERRRVAR